MVPKGLVQVNVSFLGAYWDFSLS